MHNLDLHVVVVFVVGLFVLFVLLKHRGASGSGIKNTQQPILGTSYKYTFVMLHCTGGQFRFWSPDADDGIVENFSRCRR